MLTGSVKDRAHPIAQLTLFARPPKADGDGDADAKTIHRFTATLEVAAQGASDDREQYVVDGSPTLRLMIVISCSGMSLDQAARLATPSSPLSAVSGSG